METFENQTLYEVAAEFKVGPRKLARVAKANGIGIQGGGRVGWRFTAADKRALWEAMRPQPAARKPGAKTYRKSRRSAA
jgi:hypothetical protein